MEKKHLKRSHYNFIVELQEKGALLYNTLTGMLIKMPAEKRKQINSILSDPNNPTMTSDDASIKEKLIECRFLIPETLDEINYLKAKNRIRRFGANSLYIVIAPTFDCNFRCPYCYENRQSVSMSEGTSDALKKFIHYNIDEKGIRHAKVAWYGGEPLMEKEIIFGVSEALKKIEFSTTIYSNGYLLDKAFIERLGDLHIDILYITLDGPREYHDKRRFLEGGHPTYDRIRENIYNVVQRWGDSVKVIIRTNLDSENVEAMQELMVDFEKIRGPVRFSIARAGLKPGHEPYSFEMLNVESFTEKSKTVEDLILKRGFGNAKLPLQSLNGCPADLLHSYSIDPYGNIFKCISHMNPPSTPTGKLTPDGRVQYEEEEYIRWYSYDVFEDSECRKCLLLPLCMGGCPAMRYPINPDAVPDSPKACYYGKDMRAISERIKRYYFDVYCQEN